jgi:hypothetical protein
MLLTESPFRVLHVTSEEDFQVDGTDAMDAHVVEYKAALDCVALEVQESNGLWNLQGNGCLGVVTFFDSSKPLKISLMPGPHRSNSRMCAQTQSYRKRHSPQKESALPDEQPNP